MPLCTNMISYTIVVRCMRCQGHYILIGSIIKLLTSSLIFGGALQVACNPNLLDADKPMRRDVDRLERSMISCRSYSLRPCTSTRHDGHCDGVLYVPNSHRTRRSFKKLSANDLRTAVCTIIAHHQTARRRVRISRRINQALMP